MNANLKKMSSFSTNIAIALAFAALIAMLTNMPGRYVGSLTFAAIGFVALRFHFLLLPAHDSTRVHRGITTSIMSICTAIVAVCVAYA